MCHIDDRGRHVPDEWLHQTVNVDINSVADFADRVRVELTENFSKSVADGVQPMMGVQPRFGGGIIKEGSFFRAMHDKHRRAAMYLINDVALGLQALSTAAFAVATEYMLGDAESQATVDDVYDSFVPTAPPPSATTDTTTTATTTDPNAQPIYIPPDVTNPDAYTSPYEDQNADGWTIAEGQAGEYHIGADDEDMGDAATLPPPR
jgi:hypothetical protein